MAEPERTLSPDDVAGIDALLAELDRRVREPGFYSSRAATEFARRWRGRADAK